MRLFAMKKIVLWMIAAMCCVGAHAQADSLAEGNHTVAAAQPVIAESAESIHVTKGMADSAYMRNDFVTAIRYYEDLLQEQGEAAEVYYNLGNSYYKTENIARAILNYERALLLRPGDGDIRFNLEMARSKTVDKVTPISEIFLVTWIKAVRNLANADTWGKWAVATFVLFLISFALFLFGKRMLLKKLGFSAALAFLGITVASNVFAFQQKDVLVNRGSAIVTAPSITAKSTPTEGGTDLFILHEGHKVFIKDNSMKGWKEVALEDGNVGWIPSSAIEII